MILNLLTVHGSKQHTDLFSFQQRQTMHTEGNNNVISRESYILSLVIKVSKMDSRKKAFVNNISECSSELVPILFHKMNINLIK